VEDFSRADKLTKALGKPKGTAIASNFQTTLIQVVFALANPSAVTTLG
jgi:hypothetical protein